MDFPGGVGQANVLEVVGAIHIDVVWQLFFGGVIGLLEPFVEDEVVFFWSARKVTPDNK